MKRIIIYTIIYSLFSVQGINAQSQIAQDMANAMIDLVGSFMDNPNHHSNTIKIYHHTEEFKEILDDIRVSSSESPTDYYMIQNMKKLVKSLNYITANISGHSRGGIDGDYIENFLNPIMKKFGWTWVAINSTTDIVFYEYCKESFKMVLAKNIRQKKDDGDYNATSFTCYFGNPKNKKDQSGVAMVVFGGNYQFVEFGDDETQYKTITKVTSKRGVSNW